MTLTFALGKITVVHLPAHLKAYTRLDSWQTTLKYNIENDAAFEFLKYNWGIQGQRALLPTEVVSQGSGDFPGLWGFEASSLGPLSEAFGNLVVISD